MKKVRLIVFALTALLFVSCGNNPSSVVEKYLDCIQSRDMVKAAEYIYAGDDVEQAEIQELCKKVGSMFDIQGGLEKYEIISETVADDKKSAVVEVKVTFKKPSTELPLGDSPLKFNLCKQGNKWLIDLSDK